MIDSATTAGAAAGPLVAPPPGAAAAWHTLDIAEAVRRLDSDAECGLSSAEAARRLARHGPNTLTAQARTSALRILWEQLSATLMVILIVAAGISAALGDYKDTAVILAIVVLNAILGFQQEYRAEQALAALKKLAVPLVRVRRDGQVRQIAAPDLVPGDLVLLEAGNLVPADGRVLAGANLRVQEAALTGESAPVEKDPEPRPDPDLPLGDRHDMVYMGTIVAYGRAQVLVTATGMGTELGHIATLLQTTERTPTPLQQRLAHLGRGLALAALALVGVIFGLGLLRGEDLRVLFLTAVSVAVAAVPEGLPAVVTIALALGARRMLKRGALIRKLPAVETLGSVTVICSDKTGTLTANQMAVTVLDVAGRRMQLTTPLREDAPALEPGSGAAPATPPDLALLLTGAALCNDAVLQPSENVPGEYQAVGDPTEGALVMAAARLGLGKAALERSLPRIAEVPFDSTRKRMTTIHQVAEPGAVPFAAASGGAQPAGWVAFSKGAVDSLLDVCAAVWVGNVAEPLTPAWRARITAGMASLAEQGLRVLGVAVRPLAAPPPATRPSAAEHDLIFIGMTGLIDPIRPEVAAAVATCRQAGIRPIMITGDHPLTARAIAADLGLGTGDLLTGQDLDRLTPEALDAAVERVSVFARVSPEHKLNIVQALQRHHHIVAMTGDGVNDAPALQRADIGVAMGLGGTDVAKEAGAMVLLNDNFATIVAAVEEGRVIYDNIRKFIRYILTGNVAELGVMLLGPLAGMPLPLLPVQILWINLVTDGLPALALTVEPGERHSMRRAPYPPTESIFARGLGRQVLGIGLFSAVLILGLGYGAWQAGHAGWQTLVFTTLTFAQMALVLALRSDRDSLFRTGLWSNKPILGAVALTIGLQLAIVYVPPLQAIFDTVALSPGDLAWSVGLSSLIFCAVEIGKWLRRRRATASPPPAALP